MRPPPLPACALLALALAACRCGEPPPARVFEVGAPLEDVPAASAGGLLDFVPAGAPLLVHLARPQEVVRALRADPGLARLLDPAVLADLALSDTGATVRAVRQRLNDLSRLPVPGAGLEALLDGPLALAARVGPVGTDLLVVKRLTPQGQASWKLAQMLQGVTPSLREVRVERYRGFPLRKVLVNDRRRLTYVVLRDLIIAGTSDPWVKESLDLALGGAAPKATAQGPVRLALAEEAAAALVVVVDADELRAEPGRPGAATLALTQVAWARAALRPQGLVLTVARSSPREPGVPGPSGLGRFAPKGTVAAVARSLDLEAALRALLPATPGEPDEEAVQALRHRIVTEVGPTLGTQAFWYSDGVGPPPAGLVARHVAGFTLRDPAGAGRDLPPLLKAVLAPPLTAEREGAVEVICGGAEALCGCVAGDVLLLSNRRAALRQALAVSEGRAPGLSTPAFSGATDLLWLDGPALAAALTAATATDPDPKDTVAHLAPVLAALRGLGPTLAAVRPAAGRLEGEVRRP